LQKIAFYRRTMRHGERAEEIAAASNVPLHGYIPLISKLRFWAVKLWDLP
jgi:hypothetical protein